MEVVDYINNLGYFKIRDKYDFINIFINLVNLFIVIYCVCLESFFIIY